MKTDLKQPGAGFIGMLSLMLFIAFGTAGKAYAAAGSFSLSPATATVNVNQETTFTVTMNTGGAQAAGADLVLTFDPSRINVVDITPGTTFDQYVGKTIDNPAGKAGTSGIASSQTSLFTGTGVFATVRVKGVAGGSSPLTIAYTPGNLNDSNISDFATQQDILSSVTNATITVQGAGGPTNTPAGGQPTNTPQPNPPTNTPPHQPTNTPKPTKAGGGDEDEPGDDDYDDDGKDNNTDDDDDNDGIKDTHDDDNDNDGVKNDKDDDDDNDGVNDGYDTNADQRSANKHLRTQGAPVPTDSGSLMAIILASIGYAAYWIRSILGSVFH